MVIMPDMSIADAPFLPNVLVFGCNHPTRNLTKGLFAWLRRLERHGALLGAVDTGQFALAEAGLSTALGGASLGSDVDVPRALPDHRDPRDATSIATRPSPRPRRPTRARIRRSRGINHLAMRSEITIDLGAVRRNARRLLDALGGARAVGGREGERLRTRRGGLRRCRARGRCDGAVCRDACRRLSSSAPSFPTRASSSWARSRPTRGPETRVLELVRRRGGLPEGVPVHVKLDTGMGRWGLSELPSPPRDVVGLATHLATADSDSTSRASSSSASARRRTPYAHLTRHAANSAAALRLPESRFDAARCGIALYGLSPFGTSAADDGLEPALSWTSELALVKQLRPASRPATAAALSPSGRRGSASCRSATQTASGATSPAPRCSSPASGARRRDDLDGRLRGRRSTASCPPDAGRRSSGPASARGARARRRHDHLRARVTDRERARPRAPRRRRLIGRARRAPARGRRDPERAPAPRLPARTGAARRPHAGRTRSRGASARRSGSAGHEEAVEREREPALLREAGRLGEAGHDRVHRDAARRSSTAIVRENASWACFVAEYGP